ncbi:1685_t:CDS:2, partial [Acaulospora morrowiae]
MASIKHWNRYKTSRGEWRHPKSCKADGSTIHIKELVETQPRKDDKGTAFLPYPSFREFAKNH